MDYKEEQKKADETSKRWKEFANKRLEERRKQNHPWPEKEKKED